MHIRQATLIDLENIIPLFDAYRKFYRQTSDINGARAFIGGLLENGESVVYLAFAKKTDTTPIGFTQLYPLYSSVSMEKMILLNDLFVHHDHRGKGVGKALIDTVKELCRKTNQKGIALQTETSNPAQRLYEKEGFTIDPDLHYFWTNKTQK